MGQRAKGEYERREVGRRGHCWKESMNRCEHLKWDIKGENNWKVERHSRLCHTLNIGAKKMFNVFLKYESIEKVVIPPKRDKQGKYLVLLVSLRSSTYSFSKPDLTTS